MIDSSYDNRIEVLAKLVKGKVFSISKRFRCTEDTVWSDLDFAISAKATEIKPKSIEGENI